MNSQVQLESIQSDVKNLSDQMNHSQQMIHQMMGMLQHQQQQLHSQHKMISHLEYQIQKSGYVPELGFNVFAQPHPVSRFSQMYNSYNPSSTMFTPTFSGYQQYPSSYAHSFSPQSTAFDSSIPPQSFQPSYAPSSIAPPPSFVMTATPQSTAFIAPAPPTVPSPQISLATTHPANAQQDKNLVINNQKESVEDKSSDEEPVNICKVKRKSSQAFSTSQNKKSNLINQDVENVENDKNNSKLQTDGVLKMKEKWTNLFKRIEEENEQNPFEDQDDEEEIEEHEEVEEVKEIKEVEESEEEEIEKRPSTKEVKEVKEAKEKKAQKVLNKDESSIKLNNIFVVGRSTQFDLKLRDNQIIHINSSGLEFKDIDSKFDATNILKQNFEYKTFQLESLGSMKVVNLNEHCSQTNPIYVCCLTKTIDTVHNSFTTLINGWQKSGIIKLEENKDYLNSVRLRYDIVSSNDEQDEVTLGDEDSEREEETEETLTYKKVVTKMKCYTARGMLKILYVGYFHVREPSKVQMFKDVMGQLDNLCYSLQTTD